LSHLSIVLEKSAKSFREQLFGHAWYIRDKSYVVH